ncbi:MAG: cupin domain-containing protein [Chloroflexota bacterium]|nr:cupin domain-containing protein [Chloroflexota bacterium]MDE2886115.1 cupin domain-containing protein [Chloroflexota bacterium]
MTQDYVGTKFWARRSTPYEHYMEEQGVPVHYDEVGYYDLRDLPLGPWKRMQAEGAFFDLSGTGGQQGTYVIQIPGAGAITPEKHMYEEIFYVLEGRGTTEIWTDGGGQPSTFEWQAGSLFSPPMNTWHRIINASASPALLLGVTNAPPAFFIYRTQDFMFNNPYQFADRYDGSADYFKEQGLGTDEVSGRARNFGNIIPDAVHTTIPLDGQRGAGHRAFFWSLSGNTFRGFVAEYPSGRYSKTHAHDSGPIIVCLSGKGYSITWPRETGTQPWKNGKGDLVKRQDYGPGGIVSAAPGNANWFHGHFGASAEPLRVLAFLGGFPRRTAGAPGVEMHVHNVDVKEGGNTIEYEDEDPYVRQMFKEQLAKVGATFDMPEELYAPQPVS